MTRPNIADQLAAFWTHRNTPDHDPEPVVSNWTIIPANDNISAEEIIDFGFERHLRMTPSVQEIMRNVAGGLVERGPVPIDDEGTPISTRGPIVKIGDLKFSDGEQREKAEMVGPDGATVQYDRRMPLGSMLRTREKAEGPAGGKGFTDVDLENSNTFYAATFGTEAPRFIKRGVKRNGPSMNAEQSRANLAAAIANTAVMPPITRCPPALPCGSERIADSFVAFKKVPTGQSGSVAWEDIGQTIENAKVWKNLRRALKSKDAAILDAAMQAQTYADVGLAAGLSPSYSSKKGGGRRALLAANDNLAAAIKKFAP